MKNNILAVVVLILSITLNASYTKASIKQNAGVVQDTIPEKEMVQKTDLDGSVDDTFSNLEEELEAIDAGSKIKDTTRIRIGKMKIAVIEDGDDIIINKDEDWDSDDADEDWTWNDNDDDWTFHRNKKSDKFKPHWAGFSMGLNNYLTPGGSTTLDPEWELLEVNTNNSLEVNLNFAQLGLNIVKEHVGFVTGVGLRWNNYKYRNTNTVLSMETNVLSVSDTASFNGELSKLTTCYLMFPLLIEFQIPTNQGDIFYLNAGVEGAIKLGAHTKIKTDSKSKYKDKRDFYTTSLDYRFVGRMGYGNFGVYAGYSMVSLFEKDKGPELYPIAVGITLNF